jgi:hypothetical protein
VFDGIQQPSMEADRSLIAVDDKLSAQPFGTFARTFGKLNSELEHGALLGVPEFVIRQH